MIVPGDNMSTTNRLSNDSLHGVLEHVRANPIMEPVIHHRKGSSPHKILMIDCLDQVEILHKCF
jgi:hypothetical protein